MIENATVSIYVPTLAPNDEGTTVKTWGYKKTIPDAASEVIRADVQPAKLSLAEVETYGLSNRNADIKKMFFGTSIYANINNRAYVVSDFPGEPAIYYEIKGSNHWPIHGEALLVPVIGE